MPWDDLHHKWVIPIGFMTINMETVSGWRINDIKIHQPEKFSKTGDVAVRLL
jgi:hypothetical protein